MSPPLSATITCSQSTASRHMTLSEEFVHRILSDNTEAESAPTTSPTKYYERSPKYFCENKKTTLDWYLCQGHSIAQITTLIINAKISSTLSILGSSYVIQDVLRDPKKRKGSTYHCIMLGLSSSDIIFSLFGPFLGTWVMPKGNQILAFGFKATCSVAGFFTTISATCTPLYNCSLTTFYFLRLKLCWADRRIKAVEKWILYFPCTVALITAISAAVISKLGPWGWLCT